MMLVIGSILIAIGLPTAFFDMGMNGPGAEWAPIGISMAMLGTALVLIWSP